MEEASIRTANPPQKVVRLLPTTYYLPTTVGVCVNVHVCAKFVSSPISKLSNQYHEALSAPN